jgi:hypothetical protein
VVVGRVDAEEEGSERAGREAEGGAEEGCSEEAADEEDIKCTEELLIVGRTPSGWSIAAVAAVDVGSSGRGSA